MRTIQRQMVDRPVYEIKLMPTRDGQEEGDQAGISFILEQAFQRFGLRTVLTRKHEKKPTATDVGCDQIKAG